MFSWQNEASGDQPSSIIPPVNSQQPCTRRCSRCPLAILGRGVLQRRQSRRPTRKTCQEPRRYGPVLERSLKGRPMVSLSAREVRPPKRNERPLRKGLIAWSLNPEYRARSRSSRRNA
jgi:hypothetical protein